MSTQDLPLHAFLLSALLAGCGTAAHDGGAVHTQTLATTGATVTTENAVEPIANARCKREFECNHIGNGAYDSRDQCLGDLRRREQDHLSPCQMGVDKGRLNKCVAVLEQEECLEHLGPPGGFPECQTVRLCGQPENR